MDNQDGQDTELKIDLNVTGTEVGLLINFGNPVHNSVVRRPAR